MQFHLNGFQPGDPEILDPAARLPAAPADASVPGEVDVLIVGCGPRASTLRRSSPPFPTSGPASSSKSRTGC
jgi:phenol 2-monooxygenase